MDFWDYLLLGGVATGAYLAGRNSQKIENAIESKDQKIERLEKELIEAKKLNEDTKTTTNNILVVFPRQP